MCAKARSSVFIHDAGTTLIRAQADGTTAAEDFVMAGIRSALADGNWWVAHAAWLRANERMNRAQGIPNRAGTNIERAFANTKRANAIFNRAYASIARAGRSFARAYASIMRVGARLMRAYASSKRVPGLSAF
jgi:hypothetical protein